MPAARGLPGQGGARCPACDLLSGNGTLFSEHTCAAQESAMTPVGTPQMASSSGFHSAHLLVTSFKKRCCGKTCFPLFSAVFDPGAPCGVADVSAVPNIDRQTDRRAPSPALTPGASTSSAFTGELR